MQQFELIRWVSGENYTAFALNVLSVHRFFFLATRCIIVFMTNRNSRHTPDPRPDDAVRLLRAKQILEDYVPVGRATLRRWVVTGHFPRGRLISPGVRVWTMEELKQWLKSAAVKRCKK